MATEPQAADRARYWAYTHDSDEQLLDTLYVGDGLNPAITAAADWIGLQVEDDMMTTTVRVVDTRLDYGGTTIWQAGPTAAGITDYSNRAFESLGELVKAEDVPALVQAGRQVWSFQYDHDDGELFTTIDETDLEPLSEWSDGTNENFWGPFRVAPESTD